MTHPTLEELLKSTPRLSRTDLEYIQEWMSKQPHLPQLNDLELVPILHRSDYSLERSKELLDKYLTMRTHAPEIFKFRDPRLPETKEQIKFFHVARVGKDAKGRTVVCTGWNQQDLDTFDPEAAAFIAFSFMEMTARSDPACPGYVFVMDASHLTTGHIAKASVSLMKKVLTFVQDAVPARILEVHVIRLTPIVDKLMMIIKPFLSRETQERLHFHSKNLDAFYEVIPKSLLPEEYGGTLPPTREFHQELVEQLLESAEWLQTLDKRVVDESRRPGRAKGEGDVFGVEGSFKRLDFD